MLSHHDRREIRDSGMVRIFVLLQGEHIVLFASIQLLFFLT